MKVTAKGVAYYGGYQTCGSVWGCPVCQGKILNERADQASAAAAVWDLAGNSVYMVTLTAPHDLGMRLAPLTGMVADSFRACIRGRPWRTLKASLGIAGTIRSIEVTVGGNGWHPHLHVLVFAEGDQGAAGLVALRQHFAVQWHRVVTASGYRPPHPVHGVVVSRCYSAAEAAAYVAKTQDGKSPGNELARGDLKTGRGDHRTPLEVLEAFRQTGDKADLELWREYERATKGRQRITWSKGLSALLLGLAATLGREDLAAALRREQMTDESIAAEDIGGTDLLPLGQVVSRRLNAVYGLNVLALEAAETGGIAAVRDLLNRFGVLEGGPSP